MGVAIISDSASDIPQSTAKKWGITILPLKVRFGEDEYLDGKTISTEEFYEKLIEQNVLPKTSQIPPQEYANAFGEAVKKGDEVVCLTLSSGVSGCYQSACLAAEEYEGKVFVVDTMQFCLSEYILVEYAVWLRDEGKSAGEIASLITDIRKRARVMSVFDTLEYLKAGGRLSAAVAFAGSVLSIKPVITIEDGIVSVIGKARGSKNGNNLLVRKIKEYGGVDYDMPICFGYTGLSNEMLLKYIKDGAELYEGKLDEIVIVKVGAAIGTYAGPGAIAVAYFEGR